MNTRVLYLTDTFVSITKRHKLNSFRTHKHELMIKKMSNNAFRITSSTE